MKKAKLYHLVTLIQIISVTFLPNLAFWFEFVVQMRESADFFSKERF